MSAAVTTDIAAFAAAARFADLPDAVRREARRSLFNLVGCILGGARHPGVMAADAALGPFAGAPMATLMGRGNKCDPLHATLINGLASSIYSFDDTHEQAVVHPAGPVAAPALALAEIHTVSGEDLLLGFALGVEIECRLCKALTVPPAKGSMAWSGTGITGPVGAAIAAGRMLGFDMPTMRTAMGIALAQSAGFRVMHGSLCTPMMAAHAGQVGLRAAFLARTGFSSSPVALEGRYGYLSVFAESPDLDALTGDLGTRWEILRNTYKPYPCGIVIHPIIDACLQLRADHAPAPEAIEAVEIRASAGAMALCDNRNPRDELEAHVSLHHWTAVSLIRGTTRIADMDTETAVRDPALRAFQDKVTARLDLSLAADAAVVTLRMRDGTRHTCRIEHCLGSASRPMTDADLAAKFAGMAEPVLGIEGARVVMQLCEGVETLPDAGAIARAAG